MLDETKPGSIDEDQLSSKLEEVDDSVSGRFGPISPEDAWVPGLIEVVFMEATQSGVRGSNFVEADERKEISEAWPDRLRNVLSTNGLISWKPSFPLRYQWTIESDDEARKNYEASGRDKFVTLNFPREADTLRIADELRELPEIEQAVAVPRLGPPSGPLDEPLMGTSDQPINTVCGPDGCLKSQWYIFRCHVDLAWTKAKKTSGKGVIVADIDWGFNPNHRDLANRIKKKRHMFPHLPDPENVAQGNRCLHGTAALGLAGAEVNGLGMAGVAFEADLWAIQAGMDTIENHPLWVAGINFVSNEKSESRKVIILEIETRNGGNIEMIPTIAEEIRRAIRDNNIVVCVPAGNRGGDAGVDDANNPIPATGSILVGATRFNAQANIRGLSNGGCRVVVYAPGDVDADLTCDLSNDGYRNEFGGTSSAVAKVAGAVALMLEKNSQLTHEQVRQILRQSQIPVVDDLGKQVGVLLNAEQAVCDALKRAGQQC